MAAGLGFKTFTTGEVLTAADTNGYLMQGVLVFADAAARDAAITSPAEGQFAYTKDVNGLWYYDGAAWVASGATGDIEGVTAGTGISGGGTSGTVTITNSMATAIDAKGDLIGGTGADAFDRLAVGADGTQLVADSAEATGLKWAAASTGPLTVVKARTNFTGVANTGATFQSVFTSSYRNYQIVIDSVAGSNNAVFYLTYCYGGSLESSAYYGGVLQVKFDATTANIAMSNANQVSLSTIYSDAVSTYYINVNTQAGSNTALPIVWTGFQSANQAAVMGAASQAGGTSRVYDGFQLSASTGNINGNVTIYGVSS